MVNSTIKTYFIFKYKVLYIIEGGEGILMEIHILSERKLSFGDEFPLFHLLYHRINRCSTITYFIIIVFEVSMNFGVTPTFFVEFPYFFSNFISLRIITFILMYISLYFRQRRWHLSITPH